MKRNQTNNQHTTLPESGYVRLPAVLHVVPVCKSAWWQGVKDGKFPQPVKLGPRTTVWKVADIRALIEYGLDWKQEVNHG